MSVDVYDVDLGKQLGSFKTEAEAIRRARLLVDDFGPDYAADLEIGYDDGRPNLTGAALLRRIQEDGEATDGQRQPQRVARTLVGG